MFKIENGILVRNGKKVFCIGQSYYPSFHKAKYPVPPDGDRIGEMKKDLKMMSEMGFNHVRYAAIGDVKLAENGSLLVDTPFVDKMIEEADKNDMSVSVRLEGYVVNLHGYNDVTMIDSDGNPQDTSVWLDFIQSTLHHEGINADNALHAAGVARHFSEFENVVGCQIYNEPHYPGKTFFDYHECAVRAYRKWLADKGIMSEKDAETYYPPRSRKEQSPKMWAMWRIFTRDSLTAFLANDSVSAKQASGLPTYTCYTTCQGGHQNVFRGVDYFNGIKNMDISGYTVYLHAEGSDYYIMNVVCDMNYSAARLAGKTTWCIELDSRTIIPQRIFNKNTYSVLGSGAKGILYYQWRGDYPSEATPIPNGCGLLNYDGSKTSNYENASKMVRFINSMSDYLVNSEPVNYGIGILHSDYTTFVCDALENDKQNYDETVQNAFMLDSYRIYCDIRKAGFSALFIPADRLEENSPGIKYLFVPQAALLSEEEKSEIDEFIKNGGIVYEFVARSYESGYNPYGHEEELYSPYMDFEDLVRLHDLKPLVKSDNSAAALQVLEGDGYKLIVITNTSCHERTISAGILCNFDFSSAVFCSSLTDAVEPKTDGRRIILDEIGDGGIIIVK